MYRNFNQSQDGICMEHGGVIMKFSLPKFLVSCILLVFSFSAIASTQANLLFIVNAQVGKVMQQAKGGNVYRLVLNKPTLHYFTDRPVRKAGSLKPSWLANHWAKGKNSFAKLPPNAAMVAGVDMSNRHQKKTQFITLNNPQYNQAKDALSFQITSIKGGHLNLVGKKLHHVALFIDDDSFEIQAGDGSSGGED